MSDDSNDSVEEIRKFWGAWGDGPSGKREVNHIRTLLARIDELEAELAEYERPRFGQNHETDLRAVESALRVRFAEEWKKFYDNFKDSYEEIAERLLPE